MKSERGISEFEKNLDKVVVNGLTRRQIIEKVLADPRPGLQGEEKWAAILARQEEMRQRNAQEIQKE